MANLSQCIARLIEYPGQIEFDATKPNGAMQKMMGSTLIQKLGWKVEIDFEAGLSLTCRDFCQQHAKGLQLFIFLNSSIGVGTVTI